VKIVKIVAVVVGIYAALVALFETWLGYSQPMGGNTIVITTTDDDGVKKDRVVSGLEADGALYVAANHWPRAWYRQVLKRPEVEVTANGEKKSYRAVEVEGEEFDRVNEAHPLGPMIRVLTGFPPRRLVRLDPA
jgi:hypothetical protein